MAAESVSDVLDVLVIGAGVSGVTTLKNALEEGLSAQLIEATSHVGGLWQGTSPDPVGWELLLAASNHLSAAPQYTPDKPGGVMSFTWINVSKQNYSFSDFPFPDDAPDYVHHTLMAKYINDYVDAFDLRRHMKFNTKATSVGREPGSGLWAIELETRDGPTTLKAKHVAVATGHHAKPNHVTFPGQDTFPGKIVHSVDFKDVLHNDIRGPRVLVVGIGNSAVDASVNACTVGRSHVTISTRSGAWVVPNYVFGSPTDHYACRVFLWLPWKLSSWVFETVIKVVSGSPQAWGLNPKYHALQSQPTVSGNLVFHIQRGNIDVKPNIKRFEGSTVHFEDGSSGEYDDVIMCTGYRMHLPFLSADTRKQVLNQDTHMLQLYKNVFSPDLGKSLAFIGFVQPASGGIVMMSESQARWWVQLIKGNCRLPSPRAMRAHSERERKEVASRYSTSARHTIQRDPIVYCDDVTRTFGAKPEIWRHPSLMWRLLLSSAGAAQYRLQGPGKWAGAKRQVQKTPLTPMFHYLGLAVVAPVLFYVLRFLLRLALRRVFG